MSSDRDDTDRKRAGGDPEYRVGHKRPPLHSRFKPGQSGNPRGRPKGRLSFHQALVKELNKTVPVIVNGRPARLTNLEIIANQLIKSGLTKGPQAMALLLKALTLVQAKEEADAAARAAQEEAPAAFEWGEEQEKLFQEIKQLSELYPDTGDPDSNDQE